MLSGHFRILSSNVQFVAKSNVTSPIVLLTLDFNGFIKINLKAKKRLIFFFFLSVGPWKHKGDFNKYTLFQHWIVGVTVGMCAVLLPPLLYRTDVHRIAHTFICWVLQQSAPAETEEILLIITMSTVVTRRRLDIWAITSSFADISASCLFASHWKAGGDATAHPPVRLCVFICCVLSVYG